MSSPLASEPSKQFDKPSMESKKYYNEIVWRNVLIQVLLHSAFGWEIYYLIKYPEARSEFWKLLKWNALYAYCFAAFGLTAGAHRLWAHRSYKAKLPLRIFLALGFTACGQDDLFTWSRDHRVHHKYSETDADPHNAKRGFFFSHMGWLMVKKHPDVLEKGKTIDFSDLHQDSVVVWNRKYYFWLALIMIIGIPVGVPYYLWNCSLWHATLIAVIRLLLNLHATWFVNSAAHLWGPRPYDKNIGPVEQNFWKLWVPTGEFYHNFHHVFPQDYKASEWGWWGQFNGSAFFIEAMSWIGQAYDLKTTPRSVVIKRKARTGQWSEYFINTDELKKLSTKSRSE